MFSVIILTENPTVLVTNLYLPPLSMCFHTTTANMQQIAVEDTWKEQRLF